MKKYSFIIIALIAILSIKCTKEDNEQLKTESLAVMKGDSISKNIYREKPDFEGEQSEFAGSELRLCPLTSKNAMILREQLAWLYPSLIGLKTSVGMGDRLGLATPGHIRALRAVGGSIAPIFAQQSIRENRRTGRNPQQVLDDVTWGMFQEGWRGGAGADADKYLQQAVRQSLQGQQDVERIARRLDRCLEADRVMYF